MTGQYEKASSQEQAPVSTSEGLTKTRLYMNGTLRSMGTLHSNYVEKMAHKKNTWKLLLNVPKVISK